MYSLTETSLSTLTWPNHLADSYFGAPFIDIDQERTAPVPHRHIHGGFEGTESRFSFYFPLEGYEGRFFQHVSPVPQDENLAVLEPGTDNKISSAIASGAYFIETNGGGLAAADPTSGMDPTIGAYRVSAAATQFSREVARVLYQAEHHPYGYLYGGSGGAYRTMGTSENTDGVWDGFLPYVPGTPMAIPNVFSVRMHAQRVLRHVFPQIVDAYDGGGDPAALDLTAEERAAFDEVTRMGFPPRSWFDWETMGMHSFGVLYPGVMAADPTYFEDFWTKDGYLGADPNSSIHKDRVQLPTTIVDFLADRQTPADKHAAGSVDESYQYAATGSLSVHSLKLADSLTEPILGALLIVTGRGRPREPSCVCPVWTPMWPIWNPGRRRFGAVESGRLSCNRQLGVPRRPDLPPPPDPGPRVFGMGSVQGCRGPPALPAAPEPFGSDVLASRIGHRPHRAPERQGHHDRRVCFGPRGVPVASGLVPRAHE